MEDSQDLEVAIFIPMMMLSTFIADQDKLGSRQYFSRRRRKLYLGSNSPSGGDQAGLEFDWDYKQKAQWANLSHLGWTLYFEKTVSCELWKTGSCLFWGRAAHLVKRGSEMPLRISYWNAASCLTSHVVKDFDRRILHSDWTTQMLHIRLGVQRVLGLSRTE